jgi:hypothetical protein
MRSSDSARAIEYTRVRAIALRVALFTTVVLFAVLAVLDDNLHSEHAPHGIVSLELAGAAAVAIMKEWTDAQRRDALLLQGLDYLFIPAYSTLLATAALTHAASLRARAPRLRRVGKAMAWTSALAGLADAIENVPLILMLRTGVANSVGAEIAMVFASLKFASIVVVVSYLVVASLLRFARGSGSQERSGVQ